MLNLDPIRIRIQIKILYDKIFMLSADQIESGYETRARSKKYFIFLSLMNPLHDPILVFPKFDPLTAPGMALCVNLGTKCQNLFPLVSD